jgi:hypothetical protein
VVELYLHEWSGAHMATRTVHDPTPDDGADCLFGADALGRRLSGPVRPGLFESEDGPSSKRVSNIGTEVVELLVGGQQSELLAEFFVPKSVAVTAAQHFARTEQRTSEAKWLEM